MSVGMSRRRPARAGLAVLAAALACLAGSAHPVGASPQVTITLLSQALYQPGFDVLIQNFERVYPNITVQPTYEGVSAVLSQVENTELAAGDAPDLIPVSSGSSTTSVHAFASAGYLAPMIDKPWIKRSVRRVTSIFKYGQGLYGFSFGGTFEGVFTNNDLFHTLGLKVPQTFAQLLSLCRQAEADGTAAIVMDGASTTGVGLLLENLAIAPVYSKDPHWTAELKAGTVGFDSTPGWHQAFQEFVEMNQAGCFQPGFQAVTFPDERGQFAAGQGLMFPGNSSTLAAIEAAEPQFGISFAPLPGGSSPSQATSFLSFGTGLGVNAHSSPQNQAAAQAFVDFLARPAQNALFAKITGEVTQYQILKGQLPAFMPAFKPVFADGAYTDAPGDGWWNPNVSLVLQQDGIGLITGQESIDDILNAMDAAWKQGPG